MKKFRTGNVVRADYDNGLKSLLIVTGESTTNTIKETYQVIRWVSFSSSNTSGSTRLGSSEREHFCYDCEGMDNECDFCNGTRSVKFIDKGTDCWTVLADNVQEYIINRLTQNFDF